MAVVVTSGQTTTVTSGTTFDQTDVQSGGVLDVDYGATADDTTIEGGGQVFDAGLVSGVTGLNAFLDVQNGGYASSVVFSRGYLSVEAGGQMINETASGTIDANDDGGFLSVQYVNPGALATDTLLDQGGLEYDYGEAVNTTASGRSNDIVDDGLLTYSGINAQVSASVTGVGLIDVTGAATRVDISNVDQPDFFGTFTGAAVIGTGSELELSETNALGSGTILFTTGGGGQLVLDGNATPTEAIGDFYSGNSIVITGGVDSAAEVGGNVVSLFYANGTEDDITIYGLVSAYTEITTGNGETIISSTLNPVVIGPDDNGLVYDSEMDYLVQPGGTVTVTEGGTLEDGSVGGDGSADDTANAAAVNRPVTNGLFRADDATPSSALLTVLVGGVATDTFVTSGGVEDVQSGGYSEDDRFFLGGEQIVESSGSSFDPVFNGGLLVDNGAVFFNGAVPSGSTSPASAALYTLSGSGTISATSQTLTLSGDASAFSGAITAGAGATVEVTTAAALGASASLTFNNTVSADPTIEFDAPLNNLPQTTVSGFTTSADILDLHGVGFSANTPSTPLADYVSAFITSGGSVLEVTSGGTSGTLALDSGTVGSTPLNIFSDDNGGTDISFSVLSAATTGELNADLAQVATMSNGTFTVYLTSNVTLDTSAGDATQAGPLDAVNGATLVLDGNGNSILLGSGADPTISAIAGPAVVSSLNGSFGFDVVDGARLIVSHDYFTGGVVLGSGTLELADTGGEGPGAISFANSGGGQATLQVDAAALPSGTANFYDALNDFATMSGQYIDLAGFTFSSGTTSATISADGGELSVTNGAQVANFYLTGTASVQLNVFDDSSGGTIVTEDPIPCYGRGTRILTARGEVPVETLLVGDLAATFGGSGAVLKPVCWLGHTTVDLRRHPRPDEVRPIRIRAGALAEGRPSRDLLVSPGHRLPINGMLIAASELVNGASIVQEAPDQVEYWHVELDGHDILLADGVEAESYLDTGNRHVFEAGNVVALHRSSEVALDGDGLTPCMAYGEAGIVLRRRLIARAKLLGWRQVRDPAPWLEVAGQRILPVRDGKRYRFELPEPATQARLCSRANRPSDVDAESTDRRRLGLALRRLALQAGERVMEVPLDDGRLDAGFSYAEGEGEACWRWTDGAALLPLAELAGGPVTTVEITIQQGLWLWAEPIPADTAPLSERRALAG